MPIEAQGAAQEQESPYSPPGPKPLVFEQWEGVNTNTTRVGVPDNQAFWIDGFYPISTRKARTMPGVGPALYTANSLTTIVYYDFANIGATPYSVVFLADGSVVAVNTNTSAVKTILPAGTILNPSILNVGVNQWSSQYIIIVANQSNGYWLWDGANLFTAGTLGPLVVVTNTGAGYATAPVAVVLGGHGHGASLSASVQNGQVISVSVINPGTGYLATDAVSIGFIGTPLGGTGASLTGSLIATTLGGAPFSLATISVVASGANYSNPTITFTSSNQTAPPTAVAQVIGGQIVSATITNGGAYSSSVAPTVLVTEVGVTASASIQLMPFGVQGTDVEIYAGHVWIINGPIVFFSAPGSFTDFSAGSGGGNFTSTEASLKVGYSRVIAANSVLYLVGDSSVTYISGVQTTGSPPTTTFSKLVIDPEVGSPYPASVQTYGRDIMLGNSTGIYVVAGSAAVKASEMLDGVYSSVSNFGGLQLAAAKATIFGKKVWMELVRIVDPVTQLTQNKLMIWDGKKWFSSLQDVALTFVNAQEINSVISAWGTDGQSIYPLFQQPSTGFTKRMQSKFWDAPGGYQWVKSSTRLWALGEFHGTVPAQFNVSIESEVSEKHPDAFAPVYTFNSPTFMTPWVNASNVTVPWVNASNVTVPWVGLDDGLFATQPTAIGQHGILTGFTIDTNDGDLTIASVMMQDEIVTYRG